MGAICHSAQKPLQVRPLKCIELSSTWLTGSGAGSVGGRLHVALLQHASRTHVVGDKRHKRKSPLILENCWLGWARAHTHQKRTTRRPLSQHQSVGAGWCCPGASLVLAGSTGGWRRAPAGGRGSGRARNVRHQRARRWLRQHANKREETATFA